MRRKRGSKSACFRLTLPVRAAVPIRCFTVILVPDDKSLTIGTKIAAPQSQVSSPTDSARRL